MYGFVDTVPGSGTGSTSLMSIRTIFNGIDLDQELTDETGSFTTLTVNGRNDTRSTINSFSVPGMDGAHEEGNTLDAKTINVRFRITDKTNKGFRERLNRLNALLSGSKQVLEFTDEDAIFFATVSSVEMPDEESNDLIGNIFFYCSDPYKYGPELEATFPSDAVTVTNNGTAPAKPIFELDVNDSTTFAMINNGDDYIMVGRPIEEGEIPTESYDRIADLPLSTLVGWSPLTAGTVLPGGLVGGQMRTTGNSFEAETFGTNPNGWVGPAVKTSFSETLQNFSIDITVTSRNTQGVTGKLQALLLDAADNVIATMSLIDGTVGMPKNSAVFTVGNKTIMNEAGDFDRAYNNETVHLNLSRTGRSIVAYAYKQTGSVRTGRIRRTYRDEQMEHQAPIASIILYIAKYKNYDAFPMSFNRLIADKNYLPSELEIPYIAEPGDKIIIDHEKKLITINGEPSNHLKNFGGNFFKLQPGNNNIGVFPQDTFDTKISYREPFK